MCVRARARACARVCVCVCARAQREKMSAQFAAAQVEREQVGSACILPTAAP